MLYLGLDVHSKWSTLVALRRETGELMEWDRVPNEALGETLAALGEPLEGVMETGTQAWVLYRQLRGHFVKLHVVDAATMWDRRRDRSAKTDRRDALRLAQALAKGELEGEVWIPDEHTQELRVLGRAKVRTSRWVTKLTNELGSLLRSWGVPVPQSLLSAAGARLVAEAQLPPHSQRVLTLWRELWERLQEIERELMAAVEAEAKADPVCQQLMTIPQVGALTALITRAEIGDIGRFRNPKALVSYIGLAPQVFQTSETRRYGALPPSGNRWLRYVLVLLANRLARSGTNNRLHQLYWRTCLRHDRNSAKIVVARKVAHLLWHLLSRGEEWQEEPVREQAGIVA
jgi:transposase